MSNRPVELKSFLRFINTGDQVPRYEKKLDATRILNDALPPNLLLKVELQELSYSAWMSRRSGKFFPGDKLLISDFIKTNIPEALHGYESGALSSIPEHCRLCITVSLTSELAMRSTVFLSHAQILHSTGVSATGRLSHRIS